MKKGIFTLLLFAFCAIFTATGQTNSKNATHTGKWKFEAPYAPEGFNTGTIDVKFAEDKYTTSISFPTSGFTLAGEKAKVEKDTLSFTVFVEGQEVVVYLKPDTDEKMTGKAVTYDGEIPLTLTRQEVEK